MAAECATSRFSSRNRAERHLLQAFEMKKESKKREVQHYQKTERMDQSGSFDRKGKEPVRTVAIEFSLPSSRLTHPLFQLPYIAPTVFPPPIPAETYSKHNTSSNQREETRFYERNTGFRAPPKR
jgi:hypothetical protein